MRLSERERVIKSTGWRAKKWNGNQQACTRNDIDLLMKQLSFSHLIASDTQLKIVPYAFYMWIEFVRKARRRRRATTTTTNLIWWWCEIWISDQICLIARIYCVMGPVYISIVFVRSLASPMVMWQQIENSTRDSAVVTMNDKWQNLSQTDTCTESEREREQMLNHIMCKIECPSWDSCKSAYPDQKLLILKAIQL